MSDRAAALRRYLGSRKNIAGMAGALAGVGLHAVGVIGDVWPVVAVGLYGVGALIGPGDPPGEPVAEPPRLTDTLRDEGDALLARAEAQHSALPAGTVPEVRGVVGTVRLVLDRLDEVADREVDRIAAPDRLARVAEILRTDLPACLDTYLARSPSTAQERAEQELRAQLGVIAEAADRLAAQVPDVHAQRAEELTRDLRRRHEEA